MVYIIQAHSCVVGSFKSSGEYCALRLCDLVGGGWGVGGGVKGQGIGQHVVSGAIRNRQWRLFAMFYTNNKCGSV